MACDSDGHDEEVVVARVVVMDMEEMIEQQGGSEMKPEVSRLLLYRRMAITPSPSHSTETCMRMHHN